MGSRPATLRALTLICAGALLLHAAQYLLGYHVENPLGSASGYLQATSWVAGMLLGCACGDLVVRLRRARRTGKGGEAPASLAWTWLAASLALSVAYVVQELGEALLAPGHPGVVAAIIGHGGWTAALLVVVLGLVIALLLRGAGAAVTLAAKRCRRRHRPVSASQPRLALSRVHDPRPSALALNLGGRAPPIAA